MSTQLSRRSVITVAAGAALGAVETPSFALAQPTAAQAPAVSAGEFPKGFFCPGPADPHHGNPGAATAR